MWHLIQDLTGVHLYVHLGVHYTSGCNLSIAFTQAQQDQCVRHVRTAEQMVASGHYAGAEARARAYSVLEAATALHETCDTRTALLEQSALFFRLASTVSFVPRAPGGTHVPF